MAEKNEAVRRALEPLRLELAAKRDEIGVALAPLRARRDELVARIQPLEAELRGLDEEIARAEAPLRDIGNSLAAIARHGGAITMTNDGMAGNAAA